MQERAAPLPLTHEIRTFFLTGIVAAVAHYGVLVGLVELSGWMPVPATLVGYAAGGVVSYGLNRRLTFASQRAHREAAWRFALVAGVGFCLTYGLMRLLAGHLSWPYLLAQVFTTGAVLVWSFLANKFWTFAASARR